MFWTLRPVGLVGFVGLLTSFELGPLWAFISNFIFTSLLNLFGLLTLILALCRSYCIIIDSNQFTSCSKWTCYFPYGSYRNYLTNWKGWTWELLSSLTSTATHVLGCCHWFSLVRSKLTYGTSPLASTRFPTLHRFSSLKIILSTRWSAILSGHYPRQSLWDCNGLCPLLDHVNTHFVFFNDSCVKFVIHVLMCGITSYFWSKFNHHVLWFSGLNYSMINDSHCNLHLQNGTKWSPTNDSRVSIHFLKFKFSSSSSFSGSTFLSAPCSRNVGASFLFLLNSSTFKFLLELYFNTIWSYPIWS